MLERWRPVVGWEGLYEVSDLGRVRTCHRVITRRNGTTFTVAQCIRTPQRNNTRRGNHRHVTLSRDGESITRAIHIMVLEAFVGPRPSKDMQALHWDDDGSNNALVNLRWGTASDNRYDSVRNGKHYQANQTHCKWGHEFTPENTKWRPTGGRDCRICSRARNAKYEAKRRSTQQPEGII